MKRLKYNSAKKTYTGIAYIAEGGFVDGEIIVVAPDMKLLKEDFHWRWGRKLNPKLCRKLNVTVTAAR